MLRDVFYYGDKPNVHPREQYAESFDDARQKSTTEHFWIINEFCDYRGFDWDWDFEFLPDEDVWAEQHTNIWPSQHQKDSGTWLCSSEEYDLNLFIYRNDVTPIKRKNIKTSNWVEFDLIDQTKFDFSWHPDPTDPPYIYKWGSKFAPAQLKTCLEYHVEGATRIKYMTSIVELLPDTDRWIEHQAIDKTKFDMSWRPDPMDPPFIYIWGNKYIEGTLRPTLEYRVPDAIHTKYMPDLISVLPEYDRWVEVQAVDKSKFDFSWRPDPREPAYIYTWGNKYIDAEFIPTLEYHCEGATERKYMTNDVVVLPQYDRWVEVQAVDKSKFDFSWRPDPREPAYIYVWGNKYIEGTLIPTLEYHCPDATKVKYMTNDVVVLPQWDKWQIPDNLDKASFDFSWRPDPREPDFIYEFATQWQKTGGPRYIVENAKQRKFINDIRATILPTHANWTIPDNIDINSFDFSWHPDDTDPAYIYVFGTQWATSGGPIYTVDNATKTKYVGVQVASAVASKTNWKYNSTVVDESQFDFSWHPDPREPAYIYVWGNKYEDGKYKSTIEYHAEGATDVKYMTNDVALLPDWDRWVFLKEVDKNKFDFSWRPDPLEPAYIYTWGNKYEPAEISPTLEYHCPNATDVKYMGDTAPVLPEWDRWQIPDNVDKSKFDFTWRPDPREPPFMYAFATVWNDRGGPIYVAPTSTKFKYIEDVKAVLLSSTDNWEISEGINVSDFDFSWVPHPQAPPYIYQFGTLGDPDDGPRYVSPGNNGEIVKLRRVTKKFEKEQVVAQYYIETTLADLASKYPRKLFWAKQKNIDYSTFDFTWRPTIEQAEYVHVFGSSDSDATHTYLVNGMQWAKGNRELNWVKDDKLDDKTLFNIFKKSDMFYVDKGNLEAQVRFEKLRLLHPQIQKTRYLNSWVDTIKRCNNRATSELIWVLNSELDYTDFDFEYYPNPWQMKMVHVFGTQWSHWGTTFMVNRETFAEDTKYINIIEHLSNINFVKNIRATATQCVYDTIIIDHGNKELDRVVEQVTSKISGKNVTVVKYNESYLQTLKDIVARQQDKKEHYLWLCSSVCDYSSFDFSYTVDPFARDNLHVFASGSQKFGDTFFIDVNKAKEIIDKMLSLEYYHKVNYNNAQKVTRLPEPIIVTNNDTLIDAAMHIEGFPYATIITSDNKDITVMPTEPMNLWAPETKNILVTSTGATRIVVPREVKDHVSKELYDYPYIKKASKLAISSPMDIVYLSNGETGAEENWEHLQKITKGLKNRVVRVDGVNGRVQAYHAALEASETPWAFTVFAKLKISPKFDFNWQPDRMQAAKHYIFHAKNPVNGLIYGHQAMIAYNKRLTLANKGNGLDFTLDDEHEVVPLLSGIANYNTDEFSTWRTSFREVLKLKAEDSDIARTRLDAWLNKAEGDFAQYSIKGAIDADEYYDEVDGDFDMLKLSYEWSWLKEKFANS